jgi:hypothetical protein
MTDLSPRFAKDYARNADDINRLLYVGVTDDKKNTTHCIAQERTEGV